MPQNKAQSFENHAKLVPGYHFALLGGIAINLLWAIWGDIQAPGVASLWRLLLAGIIFGLGWCTRIFPLQVQDRPIINM